MTEDTSDVRRQYEDQVIDGTQETELARETLRRLRTTFPVAKEMGKGLGRSKVLQLQCERVQVRDQQNRLLKLRMLEEINADTFAAKNRELRDRTAELQLEIEACDRGRNETIDIAVKAFELRKAFVLSGLRLITPPNVESSKSSV